MKVNGKEVLEVCWTKTSIRTPSPAVVWSVGLVGRSFGGETRLTKATHERVTFPKGHEKPVEVKAIKFPKQI